MSRRAAKFPTDLELKILNLMWDHSGPCTVTEIYKAQRRKLARTTIHTVLETLTKKGYATCDKSQTSHTYQATLKRWQARKKVLRAAQRVSSRISKEESAERFLTGGKLTDNQKSQFDDLLR